MKYILMTLLLASCATSEQLSKRHCIVVGEVKYRKETASIRAKGGDIWYRYPTTNVHVGDTVDISINDRIQPRGLN